MCARDNGLRRLWAGCVYIGITGDALLKNKKYASLLQPYDVRCGAAAAYVNEVQPGVRVQTGELHDPMVSLRCSRCYAWLWHHSRRSGSIY